ncbi:MAG: LysM peptidoglycan-binding domain-containing protein [Spartobacteria bacterium]
MKTNTTYPTKHPHWIDEPEYLDAIKKRKRIGLSFTTAFILVLAIHLAGVGGIFAFSNLKSDKKTVSAPVAPVEKQTGPKSDSLARNEWPKPEAQPKVVATPPPVKKEVAAAKPAPKVEQKPAPVIADKAKEKPAQPAIAKVTPKSTPAASKVDDSAARKAFLATRPNSQAVTETQQTIPATAPVQPVVSSNAEVKTEPVAAHAPVATAPTKTQAPAVAAAPVQSEKPTPATRPSEYTLAPGDNLYMVSRRLQVSYNELMQANGLSDPRQLRVGQKLKVPAHIASL